MQFRICASMPTNRVCFIRKSYLISDSFDIQCYFAKKNHFFFSIQDGSLLTLDEAWTIFNDLGPKHSNSIQQNMLNVLTQMEHPVLFKPFLTLHPCRIAEVLQTLPNSQNKVLSFLSIYGPTVYLTLDLEYAKNLKQLENNKENQIDD